MDRPSGPLGAATQSTGRPMMDHAALNRSALSNTARKVSTSTIRTMPSNPSMGSQLPISAAQVVQLAKEAMKNALEENQTKAAEASGVANELKQGVTQGVTPGVTIDLSHKNIQKFPDEVVDIIKTELERLALSHNFISTFPSRFSECTSLRYLNVRNNVIREFPLAICQLSALEILDLGRNKLRILPPELSKLTSLKVLSVQKNRIEDLPLCLADMSTLQVLKLDGNPVRFPPKDVLQPQAASPPNGGFLKESELNDVAVTAQIKKYLRQKAIQDRSETESDADEDREGGTETPRPLKRVMSGRFPIKVNGTDVPDLRSPALPRPPPIPSRSHYRGLSQQNAALRRPGVQPLTIGNNNERLRSNSESLLQASERTERSDRSRRMGIVSKKTPELGTVEEIKTNRYSHFRGLSHGSAMQVGNSGNIVSNNSKSPASPADSTVPRTTYVRRLSSLPERKRESSSPDPVIEGAKGILFALFQVHPLIQNLVGLARDGSNKRTSLERVFYNATTHVDKLDQDIQTYLTYSEEDEEVGPRSNENVHRACLTCVSVYIHVCSLLSGNVKTLLSNGDPRYIRQLLLYVYGSLVEVRNAGASLFAPPLNTQSRLQPLQEDTLRPQLRDKSVTPTRERPGPVPRSRSATVVQHPTTLHVTTDTRMQYLNGSGRSATMTSVVSATPRSGESFSPSTTISSRGAAGGDFTEEDRLFERIFLGLQQCSEMTIRALPECNTRFVAEMRLSIQRGNLDQLKQYWQLLSQKCSVALQMAEALKTRLSLIKLKEPGIRTQSTFWELCNNFINAYYDLVVKVKEVKAMTPLISNDTIALLRPLQKIYRETAQLIQTSPWAFLGSSNQSNGMSSSGPYSSIGVQSPTSHIPLPMTPASAALGPAVQATVPSTPQSASYNAIFTGNVFERAETFLSMNSSAATSRAGTMSSTLGSHDGSMTPASILSPANSFYMPRYTSNGRA